MGLEEKRERRNASQQPPLSFLYPQQFPLSAFRSTRHWEVLTQERTSRVVKGALEARGRSLERHG